MEAASDAVSYALRSLGLMAVLTFEKVMKMLNRSNSYYVVSEENGLGIVI